MKNVNEPKRLYRSQKDRIIGGVCGGIAEYFVIDPVWVRIAAILLLFADGIGLILYILAWILVPPNPDQKGAKDTRNVAVKNAEKKAKKVVKDIEANPQENSGKIFGFALVILGVVILMKNLFSWFSWQYVWPVALIAFGAYLLQRQRK